MSSPALAGAGRPTLLIRGTPYPVLLPTLGDPRLHLAAVIISLQILGQAAFDFSLSIAQILIAIGTSALLETGIAFWRQRVIMWPASALLTGNGVAFILRVPGTHHGDWWSLRGAWIFAATAAVSLLSKYVIRLRGRHLFNPSNIGLVICFLALGSSRADPLDFWWGPMSPWMGLALAIIVVGGLAILSRLHLLEIAVGFWIAFAAGIGVLALSGHSMTARWHLGPITGAYFWWILVSSPEILVFLFFMLSDPRTIPGGRVARLVFAVAVGLLAALLIAPQTTEFASKVAVLGALAIVCAVRPLLERFVPAAGSPGDRLVGLAGRLVARGGVRGAAAMLAGTAAFAGLVVVAGIPARPGSALAPPLTGIGRLPNVTILHSKGVSSQISRSAAQQIARSLVADLRDEGRALRARKARLLNPASCCTELARVQKLIDRARGKPIAVPTYRLDRVSLKLRPAEGQGQPVVVAKLRGAVQWAVYAGAPPRLVRRSTPVPFAGTFQLDQSKRGYELISFTGGKPPSVKV